MLRKSLEYGLYFFLAGMAAIAVIYGWWTICSWVATYFVPVTYDNEGVAEIHEGRFILMLLLTLSLPAALFGGHVYAANTEHRWRSVQRAKREAKQQKDPSHGI